MKNLPNHPEDNNSKSNKTNLNKTNHTKATANKFKFSRLISEFIVFGLISISGYAVAQQFPPESMECQTADGSQQNDQYAKQQHEHRKGPFVDFDMNKDGKLSPKEVKGPLKEDFKILDKNHDGFLTKPEVQPPKCQDREVRQDNRFKNKPDQNRLNDRPNHHQLNDNQNGKKDAGPFKDLDQNNDGKLSKEEVRGPLENDFKRFDKNSDGYLTQDEVPPPRH